MNRLLFWKDPGREQTSGFNQKNKGTINTMKMWEKIKKNTVNRAALFSLMDKFLLWGYQIIL